MKSDRLTDPGVDELTITDAELEQIRETNPQRAAAIDSLRAMSFDHLGQEGETGNTADWIDDDGLRHAAKIASHYDALLEKEYANELNETEHQELARMREAFPSHDLYPGLAVEGGEGMTLAEVKSALENNLARNGLNETDENELYDLYEIESSGHNLASSRVGDGTYLDLREVASQKRFADREKAEHDELMATIRDGTK